MSPRRRPLTIIDAMNSTALFEPWYRGDSWNNWKTVLKAAHGLPLDDSELPFFRQVAGRREPPERRVKTLVCVCGRGAGKDSITSGIVAFNAALFDSSVLRPGERTLINCLAVDREQAKIALNMTRSFFTECPALRKLVTRETANGFELSNRVDVVVQTNSHRSVRGRGILLCVMDEACFYRDETSAAPDEEVYRAVLPGLARVPNSMCIIISSPWKKAGLVYRLYSESFGQNDDDILVIQAPSIVLNPTLDQDDIDRKIAADPAAARAEWLAEWRDDLGGYVPYELVANAVDYGVTVRPPLGYGRCTYHCGCDPSGGVHDSFTAAISHREPDGTVVLDALLEIRPPFNPTAATERIVAFMLQYGVTKAIGDRYAAEWVSSAFSKCGVTYETSERDRSQIYLDCLPLFTSGRARLLDNQRLVSQFASLERRTSPMGKDRIDHGKGGHDDCCNAAALSMVLASGIGDFDMEMFLRAYGGLPSLYEEKAMREKEQREREEAACKEAESQSSLEARQAAPNAQPSSFDDSEPQPIASNIQF
jgi:hypothetical protein